MLGVGHELTTLMTLAKLKSWRTVLRVCVCVRARVGLKPRSGTLRGRPQPALHCSKPPASYLTAARP